MNKNHNNQLIISYYTLRRAIGWLGILLPFALLIGNYIISLYTNFEQDCNPIKSSISHYYYTRMGDLFVGTMCAVALFLFCYKGKEKQDARLTNLAGFFALCVIIFPTNTLPEIPCNLRKYMSGKEAGNIHLMAASLFFIVLAYISYFIFTKTHKGKEKNMTDEKIKRNIIYKICAIVMVLCMVIIALYILTGPYPAIENLHPVFWLEAIALIAFGFSWLTKGEFILKD